MERVLEVLRHRIDKLEIPNPSLRIQRQDLVLRIPGEAEDSSALLEQALVADVDLRFHLVEEEGAISERVLTWLPDFLRERPDGVGKLRVEKEYRNEVLIASEHKILQDYIDWITPRISMIPSFAIGEQVRMGEGPPEYLLYVLDGAAWLTALDVAAATVSVNDWGDPYVMVEFTDEGGKRFADVTEESVERKLAIIVDGEVVSAPVIKERIPGGRAQITLGAGGQPEKFAEARALAARLSSGILGADLSVSSVQFVGRSQIARLLHRVWWTLPSLPGLPAAQWHLYLFLSHWYG